jgi:hypothetical protein
VPTKPAETNTLKNTVDSATKSIDNELVNVINEVVKEPENNYTKQATEIKQEPPAQEVRTPTPAAPAAQVPPTATRPQTTGSGRKLSMNMLSDLDAAVTKASENTNNEKRELTLEAAEQLFEQYKQKLQAASKNVIHAQFSMMRLTVLPPDELRIISPSELTNTYAREQRNDLIDFYRSETKMIVRITTEIQEDEAVKASQNITVLSKSEMFDAMATKNPSLARLKDGLGMQIEY